MNIYNSLHLLQLATLHLYSPVQYCPDTLIYNTIKDEDIGGAVKTAQHCSKGLFLDEDVG
jgi:hypothetical protein